MSQRLKFIGKFMLFLLIFTVAARPMVVQAGTHYGPTPAYSSLNQSILHSAHSKFTGSTSRFKKTAQFASNLRFIPKGSVDSFHLAHSFVKLPLPRGFSFSAAHSSSFFSHTPQNFLVLRI